MNNTKKIPNGWRLLKRGEAILGSDYVWWGKISGACLMADSGSRERVGTVSRYTHGAFPYGFYIRRITPAKKRVGKGRGKK